MNGATVAWGGIRCFWGFDVLVCNVSFGGCFTRLWGLYGGGDGCLGFVVGRCLVVGACGLATFRRSKRGVLSRTFRTTASSRTGDIKRGLLGRGNLSRGARHYASPTNGLVLFREWRRGARTPYPPLRLRK